MLDIDLEIIVHHLFVNPKFKPIKQKISSYNQEMYSSMKVKVKNS